MVPGKSILQFANVAAPEESVGVVLVHASAAPAVPVADVMLSVTVCVLSPVSTFPSESSSFTTGWGDRFALSTAPPGWVVKTNCEAVPALTVKLVLVALVSESSDAVKLNVPDAVGTRLAKVAMPLEAVADVVDAPLKVPPALIAIATVEVSEVSTLPNWSSTLTVGDELMALPAVVVEGCWPKASLLAAPGVTLKLLLVVLVSVPSVADTVNDPVAATALVDPAVKAPPVLMAMVTVEVFDVTTLPKESCTCTVSAGLMALPACVSVGCWPKASLLAAAALTVMPVWEPLSVFTESVAVIDWVPAVFSVALNVVCVPLSPARNVYEAGKTAWPSLLLKVTAPR